MNVGELFVRLGLDMSAFRQGLADAQSQLSSVSEKMKSIGEKMSLAITAPIVAAGAVIVKGALDAETATGKLQAQLGITADAAADLGNVAKEVWKSGFGEDIVAATDAVKQVKLNMGTLANDEMEAVAQGALVIADVFEAEVTDSTKAAGTMMKNFGISGQDALDLITVGFQKGGDYSGELLDTLNEYSPQFASMGMSAEQMLGVLISGAQAGAFNLDKVGDAVKEFNIRAQDGSKTTAEGFATIGLNAEQMGTAIAEGGEKGQMAFTATIAALAAMKDPVQQNTAGVALFGTQWEDVRAKVITAMADGVKGIGDFNGATDAATVAMYENNPGLALTKAMREMQAAIAPALIPLVNIIQNSVVPSIKSMSEWFISLSPAGQEVALAIAGIVAAIGPALVLMGSLSSGLSAAIGFFTAGATGVSAFSAAMAIITGPIGIAVAAIVGIGLVIKNLWDTNEQFRANIIAIWEDIKSSITRAIDGITALWQAWGPSILAVLTPIWETIKTIVATAVAVIGETISLALNLITGNWSGAWDNIKSIFSADWELIKDIVDNAINFIVALLGGNWDAIKTKTIEVWEGIKTGISNVWTNITSSVSGAVGDVTTAVTNGLESAWDYIKSIPSQAHQWGKNIIGGLIDGIKSLHIPLPHFNFSVDYKSVAGVNFPVPDVDVNWYAKGGIFTSPTIAGIGDVPEAVLPLAKLPALMTEALVGAVQSLGVSSQQPAAAITPGATNNTYQYSFTGPITVRNDNDIKLIAQELYSLQRSKSRGLGVT